MLEILIEYGGEIMLAIVWVLCSIFGRNKTAEEIKKKLDKKKVKLLEKASKQALKADGYIEKADKIEVQNDSNA